MVKKSYKFKAISEKEYPKEQIKRFKTYGCGRT